MTGCKRIKGLNLFLSIIFILFTGWTTLMVKAQEKTTSQGLLVTGFNLNNAINAGDTHKKTGEWATFYTGFQLGEFQERENLLP